MIAVQSLGGRRAYRRELFRTASITESVERIRRNRVFGPVVIVIHTAYTTPRIGSGSRLGFPISRSPGPDPEIRPSPGNRLASCD